MADDERPDLTPDADATPTSSESVAPPAGETDDGNVATGEANVETDSTDSVDSTSDTEAAAERELGEPEPAAADPDPEAGSAPGMGRTVTVISLRVVRGLAGMAAAAAVIAAVGLVPLPTLGITPLATTVEPEPADLLALCPGATLRLGDETGANAGQPFAVGRPELTVAATGSPSRTPLATSDADSGGSTSAPTLLRVAPSDDAVLAAAQSQELDGQGGLRGLAIAGCSEPTSSAWLVGGATTVGRTTLLLLANPTAVEAEVEVTMWGESGPVSAPGMKGIAVPANGQRVLALSGFAPDLAAPMVHVEARGGQVVAALQTSVTRVLDPGGVDLVSAGAAPSRDLVIPAVRIADAEGVASSLGLEGYEDLETIVRVGNPGDETAFVEVSVTPTAGDGPATSFPLQVPAGQVIDTALSTAFELGATPFADGSYTVTVRGDAPVVAAVRASTSSAPTTDADGDIQPGEADLAWFASASGLTGDVAIAVADAGTPVLVAAATDGVAHTVTLTPLDGGAAVTLEVPASGSAAVGLDADTGYLLSGATGVAAAVTFAARGEVAGYPIVSPRAADSPLVIRP
jgi:hypothetical protein